MVNSVSLYPADARDVCPAARCQPEIDIGRLSVTDKPDADKIGGRSYTGCAQFRDELRADTGHVIGVKLSLRQPGPDESLLVSPEVAPDFTVLAVTQLGELAIDRLDLRRCFFLPAIEIGSSDACSFACRLAIRFSVRSAPATSFSALEVLAVARRISDTAFLRARLVSKMRD